MPALLVSKSPPLSGEVTIHGAKNSVLPILAATLLCRTPCVLHNCPDILDVTHTRAILHSLGCASERRGASVYIDPRSCAGHSIPPELAASMRASSLFLGALLARQGEASLSLPGGCPIGARPVDYHLLAFRALGAEVTETDDTIHCRARRLTGAKITLPGPSVGATENAILAAVGAEGVTVIENAACEPEIVDLAAFLNRCGGCVQGAGTGTVRVQGRRVLYGCSFSPMADRIVASTLACACAAAGGRVELTGCAPAVYAPLLEILAQMGCGIETGPESAVIVRSGALHGAGRVFTGVYPALATDAAPLLAAAMLCADSVSSIEDVVFERRFACADGFAAFGADVQVQQRTLHIRPVRQLQGACARAADLRGGAALVVAALAARGRSRITDTGYIDRGYAGFAQMLAELGAQIEREMPRESASEKKTPSKKQN